MDGRNNDADALAPAGLQGLAEKWEDCYAIRVKCRRNGTLLEWPSVEAVGVPSMTLERSLPSLLQRYKGKVD